MYYYSYSTNTNIIGCNLSISEFIKSIADQIQIVNYAIQNSIHMTADKYGVETKSIRNWKKQLLELQKNNGKSIKSPLHHGGKAETDEVEKRNS